MAADFQPLIGNPLFDNPVIKYGTAIGSILFFGYAMIYYVKKLVDKRPAVVIDSNGIWDNSTAIAVGLIPWTDVNGVSTITVMKQQFVVIGVNNPEQH